MRAAYEQSKILLARKPIEEVISDPATNREDAAKLALVLDARRFAITIGLDPGGSYTHYADIGKDTLAWVVMASRRDAFALHTWWFPIVGTVPYKGFFDRAAADRQAQELEERGYESSVRSTDAFSTLGWFNDPFLSTTLKSSVVRIVNTVLHESVHSTVWIPDHVPFNESLANFVGSRATVDFFKAISEANEPTELQLVNRQQLRLNAEREHQLSMEFAVCVTDAFRELSHLYERQDITTEQKIEQRQGVFDKATRPFRARYPSSHALRALNNAELLQSTIYMTDLPLFERLFASVGESWPEFLKRIKNLKEDLGRGERRDPFKVLAETLVAAEQQPPG
jgi:predicted aminopeptidase